MMSSYKITANSAQIVTKFVFVQLVIWKMSKHFLVYVFSHPGHGTRKLDENRQLDFFKSFKMFHNTHTLQSTVGTVHERQRKTT